MSAQTTQFTMIVSAVPVMRIKPLDLVNTILRTCGCLPDQLTPHYVSADGYRCSVCGKKTFKPAELQDGNL